VSGQRVGYIRVSSFDQNPDRQLDGTDLDRVFTDKASGKDVGRPQLVTAGPARWCCRRTGGRCRPSPSTTSCWRTRSPPEPEEPDDHHEPEPSRRGDRAGRGRPSTRPAACCRLPTMRARFGEAADAALREQLTYRGFLAELLMAECDDRDRRRSARRISAAGFPREKWLSDFDYNANPHTQPAVIAQLTTSAWVTKGEPLCLIGDSGTGKSHLLIGLGAPAAMAGHRVKYVLAAKLVNELVEAADERQLSKTIARYGRVGLLCLDKAGLHGTRPARRRAAVPGPHRTRGDQQRRDRVQRELQRLDQDLHRPAAVRRHRRPPHLRWQHHRDRHHVLPAGPCAGPARQQPRPVSALSD